MLALDAHEEDAAAPAPDAATADSITDTDSRRSDSTGSPRVVPPLSTPAPASVQLAAAEKTLKSAMPSDSSVKMANCALPSTDPRPWTQCAANKGGVFLLTFFSYVMFHACRKSFSAIKGEMSAEQWIHSAVYAKEDQAQMYGLLDTLFMGFYAVGLYIRYGCVHASLVLLMCTFVCVGKWRTDKVKLACSGVLGDNYDLRKMLAGGMWATGAIMLMFGVAAMADVHSLSFYAILWGFNGLIQSSGWPANVAVM